MKYTIPLLAAVIVLSAVSIGSAYAQDSSNVPSFSSYIATFTFLSADDKAKLLKAHDEVIAKSADLKAEEESLEQQQMALMDASAPDRKAFFTSLMDYEKKMRVAMLQVDSTLQPVFDQIEQHFRGKFKQQNVTPTT